jgi:hypothetical protein
MFSSFQLCAFKTFEWGNPNLLNHDWNETCNFNNPQTRPVVLVDMYSKFSSIAWSRWTWSVNRSYAYWTPSMVSRQNTKQSFILQMSVRPGLPYQDGLYWRITKIFQNRVFYTPLAIPSYHLETLCSINHTFFKISGPFPWFK